MIILTKIITRDNDTNMIFIVIMIVITSTTTLNNTYR